jgi:hypothetical protein
LESFGPTIYRPYSDITFGDENFHVAEGGTDSSHSLGRDASMSRILRVVDENSNSHVFPLVNNEHFVLKSANKNTLNDECRVITSFDPNVIVEAINQTASDQFGSITGRSLISADWMGEALAVLAQWSPFVCSLNTVSSSQDTGGPTTETKCLLFPMFDKSIAPVGGDTGEEGNAKDGGAMDVDVVAPSCVPNKICWIIFNHYGNSHEKQLETIIQQFLHGCVSKYAAKLNFLGSSCYFLSFMTLLSQAELLLQSDSDDEDDEDDAGTPSLAQATSTPASRAQDMQDFLNMLEEFLKWLAALENKIWSDENPLLEVFFFHSPDSSDLSNLTRLSRTSLMELEKASNVTKTADPFSMSKGLAPNSQTLSSCFSSIVSSNSSVSSKLSSRSSTSVSDAEDNALHGDAREWTLFMEFLDDINNFFTMLRESHVTEHIVSFLKNISKTKDYLLLEELNAHCLTKHTNGRICFLMKHAKDLIQHQDFERAVETLSEVKPTIL